MAQAAQRKVQDGMIQSGLKKIRNDHRDFDFHKSFGAIAVPSFPDSYDVDAGLWMPNQNAMALPFGCTGFTQGDLCADQDGVIYDPADLYKNTPPYDDGGRDIRDSLKATISRGVRKYLTNDDPSNNRTAYFSIRARSPLDWFDAIRLAMLSTKDEKRATSIGIPWFPEFESPVDGVLPMPSDFKTNRASWHNAKIAGWETIQGVPYLKVKSWQGENYGKNGWCYMSRELTNTLLSISGTGAFTLSKTAPAQIFTIDLSLIQTIVSFMRNLIGL